MMTSPENTNISDARNVIRPKVSFIPNIVPKGALNTEGV